MLSTLGYIGSYLLPSAWTSTPLQTESTPRDEKQTIDRAAQILMNVFYSEIPTHTDDHAIFFTYCDLIRAELQKSLAADIFQTEVKLPEINAPLKLSQSKGGVSIQFADKEEVTLLPMSFRELLDLIRPKNLQTSPAATALPIEMLEQGETYTGPIEGEPLSIAQLNESIVLPLRLQNPEHPGRIRYVERDHKFGQFYNCVVSPYKSIALSTTIQGSEINDFFDQVIQNNVFPVLAPYVAIKSADTRHTVLLAILNADNAFLIDSQMRSYYLMENIYPENQKKFGPNNILNLGMQTFPDTTYNFSSHFTYKSLQLAFNTYCEMDKTAKLHPTNPFGFMKQLSKTGCSLYTIQRELNYWRVAAENQLVPEKIKPD